MWKEIFEQDKEVFRLFLMGIIGMTGGAVRLCGHDGKQNLKTIISSLMTSAFAASMVGALMHNHVTDVVFLGAVCGMGGYCGQLTLVAITKYAERKFKVKLSDPDNRG